MKYLLLALVSFSVIAGSGDKSNGCGLGWEVTKRMSWLGSTTRGLTNATFSNTIGMTLGTSGCSRHAIVLNKAKPVHYVHSNYLALLQDLSSGQGEYVNGYAKTFGCDSEAVAAFSAVAKNNYQELVDAASPLEFSQQMSGLIAGDKKLAKNCSNIL